METMHTQVRIKPRNSQSRTAPAVRRSLAALCCGIFLIGNAVAHAVEPAAAERPPRPLSAGDLTFIRSIATQFPCAMLALLHILHDVPSWQDDPEASGAVEVDAIPSAAEIARVVDDLSHGQSITLDLSLHRYLYSDNAVLQISWRTATIRPGLQLLSFRAEILDNVGSPLQPPHVLEPDVSVAVVPDGLFLVTDDNSAALSNPILPPWAYRPYAASLEFTSLSRTRR